jgi:hypothetical protein
MELTGPEGDVNALFMSWTDLFPVLDRVRPVLSDLMMVPAAWSVMDDIERHPNQPRCPVDSGVLLSAYFRCAMAREI